MPNAKPFSPSPTSISHMHARQGLAPGRPEIAVTGSMREISPEARQHERHVPSKGDAAVATAGEERQSAARVGPTIF